MSLLAHHSPLLSTSAAETCGIQFRRERGAAVLLVSEDLDEILERPPTLTRISHQTKCIGAANQRKVFLRETLTRMAGIPRCRQSVARRCLNLHPSRAGKWSRVSMEER